MQVIFDLLSEALFNKNADVAYINIDDIFTEADAQEITPLIYGVLKKKGLLNNEKEKELRVELNKRIAKSNGIFITHVEVSKFLKEIEHTTIKGVASAKYYEEPFSRIMGDVDVIVKDFEKARELLRNNGFKEGTESDNHIEFIKNSVSVELHHRIHGIPEGNSCVNNLFEDLYEKSEKYSTIFGEVTIPSDFHHGLIMLLHMHTHINTTGIGLRHLCDWAVFANSFTENEFVNLFEEKLKNIGLWRFTRIISQACINIGLDYKTWMGQPEEELTDFIISDIVAGGNFGRKNKERNAALSLVPKDIEKKSSPVVQYFKYAKKSIYRIWPWAEKNKILLPFAFVLYCFRILLRLVFGKSKIYNLKAGYDRRDMFKKLNCFIKED